MVISYTKRMLGGAYGRFRNRDHHSRIGRGHPNALVSYIPSANRLSLKDKRFRDHQNIAESREIVAVLNELGFNVDVVDFRNARVKRKSYDLIFGLEPSFVSHSLRNPDALKVYYATGAYWPYQNDAERKRCAVISLKRGMVQPRRLVRPHESCEIADLIVQIGSMNSVSTYPPELRAKVVIIRQSTLGSAPLPASSDHQKGFRDRYVWFASNAAALRGLDLCLEHFVSRPKLHLDVIGKVEDDFQALYHKELFDTPNITYHGWMNVGAPDFAGLIRSCCFVILPTASEGFPGGILVMMKMGLIPIVTRNAAFPGFEDFAIIINGIDPDSVSEAISQSTELTEEERISRSSKAISFVNANFNINTFREDLKAALSDALHRRG